MFRKYIYRLGDYTEVEEYHTGRYGAPGQKREEKRKPTPEEMAVVNQRNKEKKCRRRLRLYFTKHDYMMTLTFRVEDRPETMEEAAEYFAKLIRALRAVYRKAGVELRWIRNIEKGTKGAWHIHLVIKALPGERLDVVIQDLWKYGSVISQPLRKDGGFRKLAEYMSKSQVNEKRLRESSYSTSRNMPLPEPEKKVIHWKTFRKKPTVPRGYTLDPESLEEGTCVVTGYPWRHYAYYREETYDNKTRGSTVWRDDGQDNTGVRGKS